MLKLVVRADLLKLVLPLLYNLKQNTRVNDSIAISKLHLLVRIGLYLEFNITLESSFGGSVG